MSIEIKEREINIQNENNSSNGNVAVIEKIGVEVKKKSGLYFFFKRVFDIFSSLAMIIVLSPILVIFALLVKFTSKGPILFKDKRVGRNGKIIYVWKFRSMYADAETRLKEYLTEEQYETWLKERKIDNDPRITKIGKFIRKTSIDELPQLFNILTGRISVVGPRPVTTMEIETNYAEEDKEVLLSMRPGLTGYWQVYGRSDVDYDSGERQRLELEYYRHRGFFFDLKIIFKTVGVVFKRKGAK